MREGRLGLTSCRLCPTAAFLSLWLPESKMFLLIQVSVLSQGQILFMSPHEEMGEIISHGRNQYLIFKDIKTS